MNTDAWTEAEAAFGGHDADWRVLFWPGIEGYYAEATIRERGEDGDTTVEFGQGASPAAALNDVVAKLREPVR